MPAAAARLMDADEFLLWCLDQEESYELVDGVPVLKFDNGPEMMAGATEAHDQIVVNLVAALRFRLRGTPCRAKTADQAARVSHRRVRRPDVTIDCGPKRRASMESVEPAVFFEVLSRTTRGLDYVTKPEEYRRLTTLRHFAVIDPDRAHAILWSRDAEGDWSSDEVKGLDGALVLAGVGVSLPMAEIYEDMDLFG